MASRITQNKSGRMRFFLLCLLLFLLQVNDIEAQKLQQLTLDEFNSELRKAFIQNNEQQALLLIKNHRFFVKPFVDGIIKESINLGLLGKTTDSKQLQSLAGKAAAGFENIFGEKSLGVAVNYLTIWSKEQKETKLIADSLSAIGTRFRIGKEGEKALEVLQKALTVFGNIQDERGEADVLGGIGAVYFDNKDYQAALTYYNRALEKREKVDDKVLIGSTLNGLGSVYYRAIKDILRQYIIMTKLQH